MSATNGHADRAALTAMASLVQLAVAGDDPQRTIVAAATGGTSPLGLVDAAGEPLGHGPDDQHGRRALAIARAAARRQLGAPPGGPIVRLAHAASVLGFLAVGDRSDVDDPGRDLIDLLPALLTDQLRRAALRRVQRCAFERRLVTESVLSTEQLRREAADIGVRVASAYRPAVLVWRNHAPAAVVGSVESEARSRVQGAVTVALDGRMVLLHPEEGSGAGRAALAAEWFDAVAGHVRRLAPSSGAQAIAGSRAVELSALAAHVAALDEAARFAPRFEETRPVAPGRSFALDRLLSQSLEPQAGRDYVDDCLGRLIAWDRDHRTSLLSVLEAALDFPLHERAAASCYMHRNTFRHRLRQALGVLGDDLDDPAMRLAIHVALKVRRIPLAGGRADEHATVRHEPVRADHGRSGASAASRARR
jgi:sugar diacid utilization regulator